MKIALVQMACQSGEVTENTRQMQEEIARAARQGADLVIFPEMSDTGYHMETILRTASTWDQGPVPTLSQAAREHRLTVVAGVSERVGDKVFNSLAVLGPDGRLQASYRKIHLITAEPVCEHRYLQAGNQFVTCTIGDFTCGFLTCYDIRFPEMARQLTLRGAELLIVPAAFPLLRIDHWRTILRCRAIENQVYVAAVNRTGTDAGLTFGGCSQLIDPYGTLLTSASEIDRVTLHGEITRTQFQAHRERMKVLADRRTDLY